MSGQMQISSAGGEGMEAMMMGMPATPPSEDEVLDTALIEAKFEALLDQGLVDAALEELTVSEEDQTQMGEHLASISEQEVVATTVWTEGALMATTMGTLAGEQLGEQEEQANLEEQGDEEQPSTKLTDKSKFSLIDEAPQVGKAIATTPELKRDQVGVESMLNDFPEGWEALLDEQNGSAPQVVENDLISMESNDLPTEVVMDKSKPVAIKDHATPALPFEESSSDQTPKQQQSDSKVLQTIRAAAAENQVNAETSADDLTFQQTLKTSSFQSTARPNLTSSMHLLNAMNDVQKQSVIKSFSQDTLQGLKGKEERLQIDLNPPELGRVQVLVQRSGDQVHAKIFIADAQLGEFLQEHLEQIRKSIESTGMRIGDFSLEVGEQAEAEQQPDVEDETGSAEARNKAVTAPVTSKTNQPNNNNEIDNAKVDMLI